MKVVSQDRYGGPEVLRVREREQPVPSGRRLGIRVRAVVLTAADVQLRAAAIPPARLMTGIRHPRNLVLGGYFAGTIEAVGAAVTRFRPGDDVVGITPRFIGALAEYITLAEDASVAVQPAGMDFAEGAALTYGFPVALPLMRDRAGVREGDRVLVIGASGSVGLAAVQVAKRLGAYVTGLCSPAKADVVRSVGADEVLDYRVTDIDTAGVTYDVIADASGRSAYAMNARALRPGGVYVTVLPAAAELARSLLRWPGAPRVRVISTAMRSNRARTADLTTIAGWAADGSIVPVVDRRFPLDEVQQAHRYLESGAKTGEVVMEFDGTG